MGKKKKKKPWSPTKWRPPRVFNGRGRVDAAPSKAPVFVSDPNAQSIRIPVLIYATEGAQIIDTFALVDSGATGSFIDRDLVQKRKIPMLRLPRPLRAQNIDGTHNSGGVIWHKVSIFVRIGDAEERREFLVLNCGKENMILGLPWLQETNPTINWASGEVHIPSLPRSPRHDSPWAVAQRYLVRYLDLDPDKKIARLWKKRLHRYASGAYDVRGTRVTEEVASNKPKVELPVPFKRFQGVFEKKNMEELPPSHSFDHRIDLDVDFVPKVAKVYPLNPKEHKACRNFVDKHLATGKIQPSKSPQAFPFFFVPKKDGSVRPCQDYRYINSHTVKNAYPLPLISDLVDCLRGSCIFTKMDIHTLGIQQCANLTRGSLEGGDYHSFWSFRTNCHVLWTLQLPRHVPGAHGPPLWRLHRRRMANHLHG
jgi:hypothetical protein